MEKQEYLLAFFDRAMKDLRINKTHLAVYMALYYLWSQQRFEGNVIGYSSQLMELAKISTRATYYTVIRQLHDYGYIKYQPSFYKKYGSVINLETTSPGLNK
jgi:hypothetical protein